MEDLKPFGKLIFKLSDHYMMSYRKIAEYLYRHYQVNVSWMTVYRFLNNPENP